MKKISTSILGFAVLSLLGAVTSAQAQTKSAPRRYKDAVEANPSADADIKVVAEYVNTLVGGNAEKAKLLLAGNYKGYGPSAVDSTTTEQLLRRWQQNYATQSNRKFTFVAATFRVKSGSLKGNWVSLWGNYAFAQNGINTTFPVNYTAHVTSGKIDVDRIYYDNLYVSQALGYQLVPPAAGAAAGK